ncbi:XapX domain-containing protein [Vibrio harveyi]
MYEVIMAMISGLIVGILFTAIKLPIPAPPVLSGVLAICSVYAGSLLYTNVIAQLIIKIF